MDTEQKARFEAAQQAGKSGDRATQIRELLALARAIGPTPFILRALAWATYFDGQTAMSEVIVNALLPRQDRLVLKQDIKLRALLTAADVPALSLAAAPSTETRPAGSPSALPALPALPALALPYLKQIEPDELRTLVETLDAAGYPPADLAAAVDAVGAYRRARREHDAVAAVAEIGIALLDRPKYWGWLVEATIRANDFNRVAALQERVARLPAASLPESASAAIDRAVTQRAAVAARVAAAQSGIASSHSDKGPVLYVVHNCLPYGRGGYAKRTHEIAKATRAAGYEVHVLGRPGFPGEAAGPAETHVIEGVPYRFRSEPARDAQPDDYTLSAADVIKAEAAAIGARVIHAASNHRVGLPAALAAAELGIPFVYEVRGFWEITRDSREPGFAHSDEGRRERAHEREVCDLAGALITLNPRMRQRLVDHGAAPEQVIVVPNGADTNLFQPRSGNALRQELGYTSENVVVGYAGSLFAYEGLDDLVEAFAIAHRRDGRLKLLLVGDDAPVAVARAGGPGALQMLVDSIGIGDAVRFEGRIPFDRVPDYYAAMDLCPFPRKASRVTHLVSPIKPLEAMAMARATLISEVGGMTDLVEPGVTGMTFPASDVDGLAELLVALAADPALRRSLGGAARQWVEQHRQWTDQGALVARAYALAGAQKQA